MKKCLMIALASLLFFPLYIDKCDAIPLVVDFSVGSYIKNQNLPTLDSSENINFSHNLYTLDDGFYANLDAASNHYGEHREYFTFDKEVSLTSIDFKEYCDRSYVKDMALYLYDSDDTY